MKWRSAFLLALGLTAYWWGGRRFRRKRAVSSWVPRWTFQKGRQPIGLAELQPRIEERGAEIFARMKGQQPALFSPRNLTGRLMGWTMHNSDLKVPLFRLVDVLPSLQSASEISRHTSEYLGNHAGGLGIIGKGAQWAPKMPWLTALAARQCVSQMAKSFILAPDFREAVSALGRLRTRRVAFTVDLLGETAVSEREADQYQARYLELIEALAAEAASWPDMPQLDLSDRGSISKVNVSIKVSALYSQIRPAALEDGIRQLSKRLMPLMERAQELGVFINFDMEQTTLKELTIELFQRLLDEPALRDYPYAGIALQATVSLHYIQVR